MSNSIPVPTEVLKQSVFRCPDCRRKKIKCLPTNRDWSKAERCEPCVKSRLSCGPHTAKGVSWTAPLTSPATPETAIPLRTGTETTLNTLSARSVQSQNDSEVVSLRCFRKHGELTCGALTRNNPPDVRTVSILQSVRDKIALLNSQIELYSWIQKRYDALLALQDALVPHKITEYVQAFTILAIPVSERIANLFIRAHESCQHLGELERELMLVHLLEAGYTYLERSRDASSCGENKEFLAVFHECSRDLASIQKVHGDIAGAHRWLEHPVACRNRRFLQGHTFAMICETAARISKLLHSMLRPSVLEVLHTEKGMDITPSGLVSTVGRTRLGIDAGTFTFCTTRDILGRNIMHNIAEASDCELLGEVIKQMARGQIVELLATPDIFGLTPLMVAAYVGDLPVFVSMHNAGADLRAVDYLGRSILGIAGMADKATIVKHILPLSHDGRLQDHANDSPPLHDAAASGRQGIIDILLGHGANFMIEHCGKRASQIARENGHYNLENYLIGKERQLEDQLLTASVHGLSTCSSTVGNSRGTSEDMTLSASSDATFMQYWPVRSEESSQPNQLIHCNDSSRKRKKARLEASKQHAYNARLQGGIGEDFSDQIWATQPDLDSCVDPSLLSEDCSEQQRILNYVSQMSHPGIVHGL